MEKLGGRDLNEIYTRTIQAEALRRKTLEAKFGTALDSAASSYYHESDEPSSPISDFNEEHHFVNQQDTVMEIDPRQRPCPPRLAPEPIVTKGVRMDARRPLYIPRKRQSYNFTQGSMDTPNENNTSDSDINTPFGGERSIFVSSPTQMKPHSSRRRGPFHEGIICEGCKVGALILFLVSYLHSLLFIIVGWHTRNKVDLFNLCRL